MGRAERRKLERLNKRDKQRQTDEIRPIIDGDTLIYPVKASGELSGKTGSEMLTPEEFLRETADISDKELNKLLYAQAKQAIELGFNPEWPEDDFGTVMWFTWSFITPEMRETFPAIAHEYLKNEGLVKSGHTFSDIPYPKNAETTWDDAYFMHVLSIMLQAARQGSSYSKNFLLSLYKVYYKREYNRLRKLSKLTFLDLLELFDEDCHEKGLPSGHTMNGNITYKDYLIEQRRHEAGWTDVHGDRYLSPVPNIKPKEGENFERLTDAKEYLTAVADAPEEPPLQPTASRLFIMCEMLSIPVDPTCNEQAYQLNMGQQSILDVDYLANPDFMKVYNEVVERSRSYHLAEYPESADPYLYQRDEKYFPLELAEIVMHRAFDAYGRNVRIPYSSRKFDLPTLSAKVATDLLMHYEGIRPSFGDVLYLSMVRYLSECLCDVMTERDNEIEELLHFKRRIHNGEWHGKPGQETTEPEEDAPEKQERILKAIENIRRDSPEPSVVMPAPVEVDYSDDDLKQQIAVLKRQLEEKEAALAEAEQKTIRQRVLYEKAHEHEQELEKSVQEHSVEHSELIALREYVFHQQIDKSGLLDESDDQSKIIDAIKDKNVAVLGGVEKWSKKMKQLLPEWSFISVNDDSLGAVNALERADFIYIYTDALQHKQYYKAMNIINSGNKMLFYLGSTNINENLRRFYSDLCMRR